MAGSTCPRCGRLVPEGARNCPFDGTPLSPLFLGDREDPTASTQRRPVVEPAAVQLSASMVGSMEQMATIGEEITGPGSSITGMKLGDYDVIELIGSGGMGEVYSGEQK